MQWAPYSVYVVVLTFLHHFFLQFLEWLSVGSFWEFIAHVIASTAVSLLLIFTIELLFSRKMKYRTNTAG
jgi:protein-S-isoprenylcysteine O-methyltransferase Ste14